MGVLLEEANYSARARDFAVVQTATSAASSAVVALRAGRQYSSAISLGAQQMAAMRPAQVAMSLNGEAVDTLVAPYKTLLEVLREDLALTGTKHGCELGECGACAVLVDGEPRLSCLVLALECQGKAVETVEGLANGAKLHPLQTAFADLGAAQCGYCTPGILMTAKALLEHEKNPSRERIKEAISGNLCRCTGYQQIFEAIEEAAKRMSDESPR
jgi:aerobic-type carbon monoxide dehydrogenase small subunit (CoxS/CutS family)